MNSQTRAIGLGAILGLVMGSLAGWLYYNANVNMNEAGEETLPAPKPADGLKWGLSLLGVMRLIAD
jgi:hypothetical protein